MQEVGYDRQSAVSYAREWAYGRNPKYAKFDSDGGDCTNFASQVLYAGSGQMNFDANNGWYFRTVHDRAPAWTGVEQLFRFLTGNMGAGPYGRIATIQELEPGDLVQLRFVPDDRFRHTPVVVGAGQDEQSLLLAAHSFDAYMRPLSSYNYAELRAIKIIGVRKPR